MQDLKSRITKTFILIVCVTATLGFVSAGVSHAKTAGEIDASVDASLERFHKEVKGAGNFSRARRACWYYRGLSRVD